MHLPRRALLALLCIAMSLALAGCSGTQDTPHKELVVFVDDSLEAPLTAIAQNYESSHPGTALTLVFDRGPNLATQILTSASADVFVASNEQDMLPVVEAGKAQKSTVFATNRMVIAVAMANPADIRRPSDLSEPGTKLAACTPEKACGQLAVQFLSAFDVAVEPTTTFQTTAEVLDGVLAATVDAGLVYRTDIGSAAGAATAVSVPGGPDLMTELPVAVLEGGAQPEAASIFVKYLASDEAKIVLSSTQLEVPAD